MNKSRAFFILLLTFFGSASAQELPVDTAVFDQAQPVEFVLLKNTDDLLPLQRLYTLRIEVGDGLPELTTFNRRYISQEANVSPNILITTSGLSQDKLARNILILSEDSISDKEDLLEADAILWTSKTDAAALDSLSQLIFGGIGTTDTLKKAIGGFPVGSGLSLDGKQRFSFSTPESLGYDGASLRHKLDSVAINAIDSGVAPGIQILVAKEGTVLYHKTYGYTTYDSIKKVTRDMLYDFASVTKITGALPALMKLHDENKFSLDATMGTYLPYFSRGNKRKLTYRRVLSHNAGLKAWIPYWTTTIRKNGKYRRKTLSKSLSDDYPIEIVDGLYLHKDYRDKIYKQIKKSPVNGGQGYLYSGLSFYLYPNIVEKLTGQNYEAYLRQNFYEPLGAGTITYNPLQKFSRDSIIPTEIDTFFRMSPLHGTVHDEGAAMMRGVSSNAGLFGTTLDLAKIMQMYLWMGQYGGEQYISTTTMEKFTSCHYCNEGNRRGLAFDKPALTNKAAGSTAIDASAHSFGHSGYTGTFAWADPDTGILFIFMSNRVFPTRDNRKLYELNVRPTMHQIIYDYLK